MGSPVYAKCWVSTQPITGVVTKGVLKGFTLIELLVVILIIGILAAVALPQYQRAVEKAKVSEAFAALESWERAANLYYMEHGTYKGMNATNVDVQFPENTLRYFTLVAGDSRTSEDGQATSVSLVRGNSYWIVFNFRQGVKTGMFCKAPKEQYLAVCRSLGAKDCTTVSRECYL